MVRPGREVSVNSGTHDRDAPLNCDGGQEEDRSEGGEDFHAALGVHDVRVQLPELRDACTDHVDEHRQGGGADQEVSHSQADQQVVGLVVQGTCDGENHDHQQVGNNDHRRFDAKDRAPSSVFVGGDHGLRMRAFFKSSRETEERR